MDRISSRSLTAGRSGGERDAGIAMVIAVAVIMLVTMVVATIVTVSLRETGLSGRERQRAVSIASAEGQVDDLVSRIDQSPVSGISDGVECGLIPPFTSTVGRDKLTINSSVKYFEEDGTSIANCAAVASGALRATTAAVRATSTSTALNNQFPAVRNFETIIRLDMEVSLNKAIFGNAGVSVNNTTSTVYGSTGVDNGDVYSNGDVECSGFIYGSIYAHGDVTFRNECNWISGDVWAVGQVVSDANSMTMVGDIKSSSNNIRLNVLGSSSNKVFLGTAQAALTTSGSICPGPKCNSNQSVDPPPSNTFPEIAQSTEWTDAAPDGGGYVVKPFTSCVVNKNDTNTASLGYWFRNTAPTISQPTLIRVPDDCTVEFTGYNGTVVTLNQNVAMFARGNVPSKTAFLFSSRPKFVGTSGAPKNLYFIQDYQTPDCSKTGIRIANHLTADDNVRAFFYTPHNLLLTTGNTDMRGQLYAGCAADSTSPVDLTYDPLPIYGVQNTSALSFRADIVAKREVS